MICKILFIVVKLYIVLKLDGVLRRHNISHCNIATCQQPCVSHVGHGTVISTEWPTSDANHSGCSNRVPTTGYMLSSLINHSELHSHQVKIIWHICCEQGDCCQGPCKKTRFANQFFHIPYQGKELDVRGVVCWGNTTQNILILGFFSKRNQAIFRARANFEFNDPWSAQERWYSKHNLTSQSIRMHTCCRPNASPISPPRDKFTPIRLR